MVRVACGCYSLAIFGRLISFGRSRAGVKLRNFDKVLFDNQAQDYVINMCCFVRWIDKEGVDYFAIRAT